MKVVIKTKNLKLNRALSQYIKEKLGSLEKFTGISYNKQKYFNNFFGKGKPRVEMWVEIGRTTLHHKKGKIFRAEAQMRLPGRSLRSEATSKDLRLAITEVKDELQRQLKQYKDKSTAQAKRKQRVFKKSFRLAPGAKFRKRKGIKTREEGI